MSSVNQVMLIGRLGQDPTVRYMPNGDAVASFTIATSEKWKDKASGEQREATEWTRINAFGKLAEISGQYLKKGSLVFVQGKLVTRKYTDKTGAERQSTEVKIDQMKMLGSKPEDAAPQREEAQPKRAAPAKPSGGGSGFDDMDDDIPF